MNTALRILKALQERNKTLSELSRELGVTKPSLLYHMLKLSERGLVRRVQNGNKFVYYSLTEKGKNFVRLLVSLISSSVLSYVLASLSSSDKTTEKLPALSYMVYQTIRNEIPVLYNSTTCTNYYVAFILAFVFIFAIVYLSLRLIQDG
jgi:DNA-binding MarR family transcriptional regulator